MGNLALLFQNQPDQKINFMNQLMDLKMEAQRLLNEVNHKIERSPNGREVNFQYDYRNFFEEQSFKERLVQLRKQVALFHASSNQSDRY